MLKDMRFTFKLPCLSFQFLHPHCHNALMRKDKVFGYVTDANTSLFYLNFVWLIMHYILSCNTHQLTYNNTLMKFFAMCIRIDVHFGMLLINNEVFVCIFFISTHVGRMLETIHWNVTHFVYLSTGKTSSSSLFIIHTICQICTPRCKAENLI